ncbi:hypothetical protein OIO90_002654 [Microbotryomycetes sp. JL221]|nr:hypothetical protein OIO90_002654 [Microbotryomycetes sp. JL221]
MSSDGAVTPVSVSYQRLISGDPSLSPVMSEAFSSSATSLGLLIVTDLPDSFQPMRRRLLRLINSFASLPHETREFYADPQSGYMFGWSEGKERMSSGEPDLLKGSFYNNPTYDDEDAELGLAVDHEDQQRRRRRNIWPDERGHAEIAGFRDAFKELCAFMVDVGKLVARACQPLVMEQGQYLANTKTVEELVSSSRANKARLLHYFAPPDQVLDLSTNAPRDEGDEAIDDSWCGTHIDHSLLTVLCPSMYLFHPEHQTQGKQAPVAIPSPSRSTGLFIKTRAGRTIRAVIPENCLALQTGETLELLSDNRLAATPHFVNATSTALGQQAVDTIERQMRAEGRWRNAERGTVTRETLAVFLQPDLDEVVSKTGETFRQFSERVHRRHYQEDEI